MGLMIFKINPTLIEVGVNQDAGNAMYFAYGVWLVHFFGFLVLPPSLFFDTCKHFICHTMLFPNCHRQVRGGGLCLGHHGDLIAAGETAALLFCYMYL